MKGANHPAIYGCIALVCLLTVGASGETNEAKSLLTTFTSDWPVGDQRRCQEQARASGMNVTPFEVLPGLGWDNLRNLEAGQVVVYNYSRCQVTSDGRFLIPDNIFTVPIKTSEMETFATLIDQWHNTSSLTSDSINVHAGLHFKFSISGKFSYEHTELKSKQIEDKAVTVRVQLRYKRYQAMLQPDPVLSPQFKSRILQIAARVELNQTDLARYEADLVIRDFGTHVLTAVTAGAALVKDDYLKREYVASQEEDKTSILASASASFAGIFSMGADYTHKTDSKVMDEYKKKLTHSYLRSLGGPLALTNNMTAREWSQGVDANLVAMDRSGDPLYFLITPSMFPELPATTVADVEKLIRHATEVYYQMNVIPGCTKIGSPKFSFSANFDDGSCTSRPTNNTFGGVYQTCSVSGRYLTINPCTGLGQVNPKTGYYSCPPSYNPVKVHSASKKGTPESRRSCHHCGFLGLSHCCHTDQYLAIANYETYWCAATGPVKQESGYIFGGAFTSMTDNLVTGDKGCPPNFYARLMFTDLSICISDDYELDTAFSVPFGGFFSCNMGNPLASAGVHPVGGERVLQTSAPNSLKSFMAQNSAPNVWPKRCPEGYSQHMATEDSGCSIHYCVLSGALSGPALPPVKRPPFMRKPPTPLETPDNLVMFDLESQTWMKNEKARKFLRSVQGEDTIDSMPLDGNKSNNSGLSAGAASGISIAVTLVLVGISTLAVLAYRKRQKSGAARYRRLSEHAETRSSLYRHEDAGNYGTIGDQPGGVVNENEGEEDDVPQAVVAVHA